MAWRRLFDSTAEPADRAPAELSNERNPILRYQQMPTLTEADAQLDAAMATVLNTADANDELYEIRASFDYDPGRELERIRAPLVAINSADDLINPPELGILERVIQRVANGRAVLLPLSPATRGHGTDDRGGVETVPCRVARGIPIMTQVII